MSLYSLTVPFHPAAMKKKGVVVVPATFSKHVKGDCPSSNTITFSTL
jgi:hypothetical protein